MAFFPLWLAISIPNNCITLSIIQQHAFYETCLERPSDDSSSTWLFSWPYTIFVVEATQARDLLLLGLFGVVRKRFNLTKLLVTTPFIDCATCVDGFVSHGKCGYLGNSGRNRCKTIRATSICRNGYIGTIARYGFGGTTKFCWSRLGVIIVC